MTETKGFYWITGAQGEKGREKAMQRWAGIRLGASMLNLSSKGSLFASLATQLIDGLLPSQTTVYPERQELAAVPH